MYKHNCIFKSKTAIFIYSVGIPIFIGFITFCFLEYREFYSFKNESSNDILEQKILLKEIKGSVDKIEIQTARIDQQLRDREEASINIYRQIKQNESRQN